MATVGQRWGSCIMNRERPLEHLALPAQAPKLPGKSSRWGRNSPPVRHKVDLEIPLSASTHDALINSKT